MDFSKLKLELYDILAVVVPGLLLLCGLWVLLRGWATFAVALPALSGSGLTIFLLASFPIGHLIQELGDVVIKKILGERYFKRARDEFWASDEGAKISRLVEQEVGFAVPVDTAFDFCLTKIKARFPRRDVFLATSDFCRSLLVVGFLLIPVVIRLLWDARESCARVASYSVGIALTLPLALYLAARRMVRFRELSEKPVFGVYLSCASQRSGSSSAPLTSDEEEE